MVTRRPIRNARSEARRRSHARRRRSAARAEEVGRVASAASRLDDGELDRAWTAALRRDTSTLDLTLARTMPRDTPTPSGRVDRAHSKQRTPWRDSSWLFGRRAFDRTNSTEDD